MVVGQVLSSTCAKIVASLAHNPMKPRQSLLRPFKPMLQARTAAAAAGGSAASKVVLPKSKDDRTEIDLDAEKLVNFCCCNYMKNSKPAEIKPDSEYPDWLFKLHLGPPVPLHELEEGSWMYWRRVRRLHIARKRIDQKLEFKSAYVHRHYIR